MLIYFLFAKEIKKKDEEEGGRWDKQFSRKPMPQDCVLKKAVFRSFSFFFFFFRASIQNLRGAKWEHSFKYSSRETNGTLSKIQLFRRIWEIKLYLSHSFVTFRQFFSSRVNQKFNYALRNIAASFHFSWNTLTHTRTSIIILLLSTLIKNLKCPDLDITVFFTWHEYIFLRRFN